MRPDYRALRWSGHPAGWDAVSGDGDMRRIIRRRAELGRGVAGVGVTRARSALRAGRIVHPVLSRGHPGIRAGSLVRRPLGPHRNTVKSCGKGKM
jgi:hypothetical protein